MQFQLDITITEADYLAFNDFHALESAAGKKQIKKNRTILLIGMAFLLVYVFLVIEWTILAVIYAVLFGTFTAVYLLFFKKFIKQNIRAQVKKLKKTGKLPFDPAATLEFGDDKLVQITADKRIEQSYSTIERICVVKDQYIFLYESNASAHILPIAQIKEQINQDDFLRFLCLKCNTIEYY